MNLIHYVRPRPRIGTADLYFAIGVGAYYRKKYFECAFSKMRWAILPPNVDLISDDGVADCERQIRRLEAKFRREKQFNRKIPLNRELREVCKKFEGLKEREEPPCKN